MIIGCQLCGGKPGYSLDMAIFRCSDCVQSRVNFIMALGLLFKTNIKNSQEYGFYVTEAKKKGMLDHDKLRERLLESFSGPRKAQIRPKNLVSDFKEQLKLSPLKSL